MQAFLPYKLAALFLDRSMEPGQHEWLGLKDDRLVRASLPDCLSRPPSGAGPWVVFESLVLDREARAVEAAPKWRKART